MFSRFVKPSFTATDDGWSYAEDWPSWDDLDQTSKRHWIALGWNQDSWSGNGSPPASDSFVQLSSEQQAAVLQLGYTQETWDAEAGIQLVSQQNLPNPAQQQLPFPMPSMPFAMPKLVTEESDPVPGPSMQALITPIWDRYDIIADLTDEVPLINQRLTSNRSMVQTRFAPRRDPGLFYSDSQYDHTVAAQSLAETANNPPDIPEQDDKTFNSLIPPSQYSSFAAGPSTSLPEPVQAN
jgi:hypothetical protein